MTDTKHALSDDERLNKTMQLILENPHGAEQQVTMLLRELLGDVVPPVHKKLGSINTASRDKTLIDKAIERYKPLFMHLIRSQTALREREAETKFVQWFNARPDVFGVPTELLYAYQEEQEAGHPQEAEKDV